MSLRPQNHGKVIIKSNGDILKINHETYISTAFSINLENLNRKKTSVIDTVIRNDKLNRPMIKSITNYSILFYMNNMIHKYTGKIK